MLKKIMLGALAAGALAFNAPAAIAAEPTYACNFRAVQQQDATGQNFEGVAYGVIADADGDQVAIKCAIHVSGSEASATPVGSGTGAASTSGRITYAAGETEVVELCTTVWVNGTQSGPHCVTSTRTQIPPQPVIDAINTVVYALDNAICPELAKRAGTYGPVVINSQGDVYVAGEPQWDCPPYDIWPPS